MTQGNEYLFRFEDARSEPPYIYLLQLRVMRTTAKGYWIDAYGKEKFVLAGQTTGRRFAYETEDDAWYSYKKRKEWQRRHLEKMLRHVDAIDQLTVKPWTEAALKQQPASIFDFGALV